MREIRTSGSEGGGIEANRFSLPLSSVGGTSGGDVGPGFRRDSGLGGRNTRLTFAATRELRASW